MPTKIAAKKSEVLDPAAQDDRPAFDELDSVFAEEGEPVIDQGKEHISSFAEASNHDHGIDWAQAAEESKRAQDAAIQDAVRQAIAAMGLTQSTEPALPQPEFVAPTFKYHFRNDVSPHVKIQAMDMSALDRGERPQDNPLNGHWYEFHVGHFQTNDENAARQLHWMMEKPAVDANGQTVGGNLAIYEDDNSVIYRCPQCEFVTASPAGYKAHRRATHGEF